MERDTEIMYSQPLGSQKRILRFREVKPFAWGHRASKRPSLEASILAPKTGVFPPLCLGIRWLPSMPSDLSPWEWIENLLAQPSLPKPFWMFPGNMGSHFRLTAAWGRKAKKQHLFATNCFSPNGYLCPSRLFFGSHCKQSVYRTSKSSQQGPVGCW